MKSFRCLKCTRGWVPAADNCFPDTCSNCKGWYERSAYYVARAIKENRTTLARVHDSPLLTRLRTRRRIARKMSKKWEAL